MSRVAPAGIDGNNDGLGAKLGADFADEFRTGECRRVDADLIGARVEDGCGLVRGADAATDGEGDEEPAGGALDSVEQRAAAFVSGRDVEKDDFVGAGSGVAGSQFGGITGIDEVNKLDPFDDAAVPHIEAGEDALGQHGCHSRKLRRTCSPASPDFSGWNWTPITLLRSTAAEKGSPYSVTATVAFVTGARYE